MRIHILILGFKGLTAYDGGFLLDIIIIGAATCTPVCTCVPKNVKDK